MGAILQVLHRKDSVLNRLKTRIKSVFTVTCLLCQQRIVFEVIAGLRGKYIKAEIYPRLR